MIGRRVLVTGGTGVVGRPLVAALLAMGREVQVLSRKPPGTRPALAHPGCTHLQGDVSLPSLGLAPETYRALAAIGDRHLSSGRPHRFQGGHLGRLSTGQHRRRAPRLALATEAGAHLHHVSTAFVRGDL